MALHKGHRVEDGRFLRDLAPVTPDGSARGTLCWIHGLGESGLCFEQVVGQPPLPGWRHLIPDLPGYGRSPWPAEPLSFDALVATLATWLDALDEPVVLLGHSMGGVLATMLAEARPDRVRALVNVDGNLSLGDCVFSQRALDWRWDEHESLASALGSLADEVLDQGLGSQAMRGYYASLRLADPRSFLAHSRELVRLSEAGSVAPRLKALPCPVLYVAGSPYGASAGSLAQLAEQRIPHARISPSGHWPFIDQPVAFAELLGSFLSGLTREWNGKPLP